MKLTQGLIGGAAIGFAVHAGAGAARNVIAVSVVLGTIATQLAWNAMMGGVRGSSAGFWHSTVGRWLIGRIAGAAVYAALVALLWYPAIYAMAYGAAVFIWIAGFQAFIKIAPAFAWLMLVLAMGGAWPLRTPAKVLIGRGSVPLRRFYRSLRMGHGGSAGFAGICEEWANRWRPGMLFFGHSLFDRHWAIGVKDDRMLSTLAGTGGGKGESAIIANVLLHQGSLFCVDFKGQIAAVTAEALRRRGYTVHIIDHFNVLGSGTARIDPLSDLDPGAIDYVERLKKVVGAMTISTGERNRFFEEGGKTLCAGAIDYLMRRQGEEFVYRGELEPEEVANE
jgi:type IV secretory pathway TraG/TraD family ATPase VirD4